jgi:hypothetical protein
MAAASRQHGSIEMKPALSLVAPTGGARRRSGETAYLLNACPQVAADALDAEDRPVVGVHVIYVRDDVPLPHRADAVLDIFHSKVPVGVLEDFSFDVVDGETGRVVDRSEDGEDYAFADHGDYGFHLAEQPLEVAAVAVLGHPDDGEAAFELGAATIAGESWQEIEQKAVALFWDERLRTTGVRAVCERSDGEEPSPAKPPRPAQR